MAQENVNNKSPRHGDSDCLGIFVAGGDRVFFIRTRARSIIVLACCPWPSSRACSQHSAVASGLKRRKRSHLTLSDAIVLLAACWLGLTACGSSRCRGYLVRRTVRRLPAIFPREHDDALPWPRACLNAVRGYGWGNAANAATLFGAGCCGARGQPHPHHRQHGIDSVLFARRPAIHRFQLERDFR